MEYDGIYQDGDCWRVKRLPRSHGRRRVGGAFPTPADALRAREQALRQYEIDQHIKARTIPPDELYQAQPVIQGVTPDRELPIDDIWRAAFNAQTQAFEIAERRRNQSITLPNEPVAIAFLSDWHIGSSGTDYKSLRTDCETIRDTDGMYVISHGDNRDNWIVGKLAGIQRGQAINFDAELALEEDVYHILGSKLIVEVSGNHDAWTRKIAGFDRVRELLRSIPCLYDPNQVVFTLQHGAISRRVCVRHKWKGNSIFNSTHAIETSWERMGVDFDWGIGGHTHIGTFCREFIRHGKRRCAILTGAYKLIDGFGEEIGFAPTANTGCGAMVLHPDGREWFFARLSEAAEFVTYLRSMRK